jgi:hypothetical protein
VSPLFTKPTAINYYSESDAEPPQPPTQEAVSADGPPPPPVPKTPQPQSRAKAPKTPQSQPDQRRPQGRAEEPRPGRRWQEQRGERTTPTRKATPEFRGKGKEKSLGEKVARDIYAAAAQQAAERQQRHGLGGQVPPAGARAPVPPKPTVPVRKELGSGTFDERAAPKPRPRPAQSRDPFRRRAQDNLLMQRGKGFKDQKHKCKNGSYGQARIDPNRSSSKTIE